jgi:hypothetical protein
MDASLLFRKRHALSEDGLDWLKGSDEFPFTARRNPTGAARVSAILVRALLAALDGHIRQAVSDTPAVSAQVASKSRPGVAVWCWFNGTTAFIPHGAPDRVTYHLGVLFITEALAAPERAADFWHAYAALQDAYARHGRKPALKEPLIRCADELYYFGRYLNAPVGPDHDRFLTLTLADNERGSSPGGLSLSGLPLTDAGALKGLLGGLPAPSPYAPTAPSTPGPLSIPDGFLGWQLDALAEALHAGLNVLLTGPTGTGKSMVVQQVVLAGTHALVTIEGKEGLTDLDFLGAILPQTDGSRRWVDGPLLRALRQAQFEPVVLFLDEINRVRREHLNLLLGLLNPKPGALLRRQGLAVPEDGRFYLLEVPLTSESVWCPVEHLRLIGAGNFGADYAVYPLDPAVRRRFDLVLDFDYLPLAQEQALVEARTPLNATVARALCLVAQYTRQMRRNGDLPGCIDTASLLMWARLCAAQRAETVAAVMALGQRVWADLACGRDHLGLVRTAKFAGLTDYLVSQGVLPKGDLDEAPSE